jgi:hypothetical protein
MKSSNMKASIVVADRKEAALIIAGLSDPVTRAVVKIVGALQPLPTDKARRRVLRWAAEKLEEEREDAEREDAEREDAGG